MPSLSEFASLYLFDGVDDATQSFLEYRVDTSGTQASSNMRKIDKLFQEQHTKLLQIQSSTYDVVLETDPSTPGIYTVIGVPTDTQDIYTIRFLAPKNYVEGETLTINGTIYPILSIQMESISDDAWTSGALITLDISVVSQTAFTKSGTAGEAATIDVGTVSTVDYGTGSNVTNSGTETNAVFDFTLERGPQGPMGPAGQDGTGVSILGYYDTIEALEAEHPTGNAGDAYLVGDNLYVWDATDNVWKEIGVIRGPQGIQGPQGPAGTDGKDGLTTSVNGVQQVNGNVTLGANNITSGVLAVANGGTGATTLALARNAMGLGNTTGAVPVANGGTGQTTVAAMRNAFGLGNTTGAVPVANGGTGATTAINACSNLRAASLTTTSTQVFTGTLRSPRIDVWNTSNNGMYINAGNTSTLCTFYGVRSNSASAFLNFVYDSTYGNMVQIPIVCMSRSLWPINNAASLGGPETDKRWSYVFLLYQPDVSSDERLKDNINSLDDDFVNTIFDTVDAKSFTLKYDDEGKTTFGFVAQDVIKSFEDAGKDHKSYNIINGSGEVNEDDDTKSEYYSMQYGQMIPILWKKVKMLQKEIDELKNRDM